jgi:ParG
MKLAADRDRSAGRRRQLRPEVMKRLTIDVSESLHTKLKVECARRGVAMADVIRERLEREFR